jgi:glycosyltransferase involved in cell wall biosynthesis
MNTKKVGFVIPWYHKDIPGGAEQELRGIVKHLHQKNIPVEILTTCVKEFSADWTENYFKEGMDEVDGIPVRRFKVRKGDMEAFHKVNAKLMSNQNVSSMEEHIFIDEMVNSPDMYKYIYDNSEDYHRLVYIPYMFGTTYFGIKACPYKSVLIPCLHDEAYAHMRIFWELYRNVEGMLFNAKPEMELANRLYNLGNVKQEILGVGVETDFDYDASRFRKKYGINEPYIIYAGRKDSAKNIDTLIKYFDEFKRRNVEHGNLKLVLIGGGSVNVPETCKNDVIDLGFVDIQDKYDACAGAELLCQPSKNESFSIVIMESWLCERPVLVHEGCAVTTNFAKESNAGLYFNSYFEFEGCVKYILENTETAEKMGKQGRQFVLDNFKWDVITDKICKFLEI